MANELFDVAVVGSGPAGSSAALLLAQKGRRVVLVEREKFPRAVPCSGWISARAAALVKEWGVKPKQLLDTPFTDVTFYNADLEKKAKPAFTETPGYLVDRGVFDQALADAAAKQKAEVLLGRGAANVRLNESSVTVQLANGKSVESRLLLLAPGRASQLFDQLGVRKDPGTAPVWSAHLMGAIPSSKGADDPKVSVILGLDGAGSFGFSCLTRDRVSLDISWMGDPLETRPRLAALARRAAEREVVPVDLSAGAAKAPVLRTPAGAALDMDSHVRKHTLLIGDAGGFVSAVSNEGIYPAMWSAKIAADVVDEALSSDPSQDTLMTFDSRWRMEMADYLRSPHTDIRFILPLIFTNQPMADRMGAAFFFGENI